MPDVRPKPAIGATQPAVRDLRFERNLPLGLDEVHANDVAQDALFDKLDDHPLLGHAEVVLRHLEVHAVATAGVDDLVATGQGQRHRLFHHDMLAVLGEQAGEGMVRRVAGDDIDGEDILVLLEHLLGTGVVGNAVLRAVFGGELLVHVAQRDEFDLAAL